ncbi:proline--tRNA ligase anticodon binding domain-containing protein, partial [Porcincola intestinalis]
GMTTRLIGAIIMVHGDNSGLKLPPLVAPVQVMVIPVQQKKEGVLDKAEELKRVLTSAGIRARLDDADKSPGWKFSDQEMRGIPVRVEIGPKDIEKGQCVIVRRDTREKIVAPLEGIADKVKEVLDQIQHDMYENARARRDAMTYTVTTKEEFTEIANTKPGFIKAMWCGDVACENAIKDELGGVTSRCIPFQQEHLSDTCVWCGRPAKKMVYWGKAY